LGAKSLALVSCDLISGYMRGNILAATAKVNNF